MRPSRSPFISFVAPGLLGLVGLSGQTPAAAQDCGLGVDPDWTIHEIVGDRLDGIEVLPDGTAYATMEFETPADDVAATSDGGVVAAGSLWDSVLTTESGFLLRITADGQLDPGFGTGGHVRLSTGVHCEFTEVEVLPDGKILVAGTSDQGGIWPHVALARYHADGSLDASYGNGGTIFHSLGGVPFSDEITIGSDGSV